MRNSKKIKLFAILLAATLLMTTLPLYSALAEGDGPGHIVLLKEVSDEEKSYLQTVTGAPDDKITIYVPIINKNLENATDLKCTLLYPAAPDATVFPFTDTADIKAGAHQTWNATDEKLESWNGGSLAISERAYFKMTATLLPTLTAGDYYLPFVISYKDGGTDLTDTVLVHDYVRDKASSGSSSGGSSYKSKPKVILESYSFSEETIYAGDTVTLRLVIANTSTREAITNLTLDFANEAGVILPAPGGSSSVFIGTIDQEEAYMLTVKLQIAPDAEAKSQLLTLKLAYEGTKNRSDFEETASVSVPVQQEARVRINDPVVYDDPWIGSNVSIGVTLYNLGKSTLYNCMVDVVGDGLTLEESYFGGNVTSGGTMRADLIVTPTVGGQLDAKVRVTYEDVTGNATEELLPMSMFVNEDSAGEFVSPGNGGMEIPGDKPANANIGWVFWTLGGVAAVSGLVFLSVRAKKKRERALEEE
jgi:hypothetical protein